MSRSSSPLQYAATILCRLRIMTGGIALCLLAAIVTYFFPPALAVIFCMAAWKIGRPTRRAGTTHGTARWAGIADLRRAGCLFHNQGGFIGRVLPGEPLSWIRRQWALWFTPLRQSLKAISVYHAGGHHSFPLTIRTPSASPHMFVFGASGSGKSTCFAMQMLLHSPNSMVVMDPKGELARMSATARQDRLGQKIFVIDPFDISQCGFASQSINPLASFRSNDLTVVDEARRLANSLIVTKNENDRFWSDSSISVVTGIMAFLMSLAKDDASLNHLRDITSDETLFQQCLAMMAESEACHGMLKRLAGELGQLQDKVKSSVMSVTSTNLSFLDSVPVSRVLQSSSFDPSIILSEKATIYVCLPIDRLEEMAPLQRVILTTLINLVFAAGEDQSRDPIEFLIDEAAALAEVKSVYSGIQFGRSYGIQLRALYQSSSQLERSFPGSQKQDVLATVAKIYAGTDDYETAKQVSDALGNETILSMTTQSGWNTGSTTSNSIQDMSTSQNSGASDSTSYAEQSRNLLTPSEILTLPRNLGIAVLPGLHPLLFEKVPYYARIRFRSLRLLGGMFIDLALLTLFGLLIFAGLWFFLAGQYRPEIEQALRDSRNLWQN